MNEQYNGTPAAQGITIESAHASVNDFIHRVYAWMAIGLGVTAAIAYGISVNVGIATAVLSNPLIFYGIMIVELLAVIALSHLAQRISSEQAAAVFLFYAALNGVTFSVIFLVYQMSSIASVFLVTAGMFAATSIYGFITKRDLTTVGHFAFMGLIGIVIASIVNLFFMNDGASLLISYIAVIIFTVLTAYDTQKIKSLAVVSVNIDSEDEKKASIIGALTLYLDFINLFINLLRIMGRRR